MDAFAYCKPESLADAISLLSASSDAAILAGGTDLLSLMKDHVETPGRVVNIKGLAELRRIHEADGGYRVGSLVTFEDLLEHSALCAHFPALAEAARGVSSPQIRDMGTVGGDLLQRPRCWYYRAGFGLLARDGQGRPLVPNGENQYHAIFATGGPAYFVSPSSLAPALIALGAKLRLHGRSGPRDIAAAELFVLPKSEGEREHSIQPGEVLTEIVLPASAREWRSATYEVREKQALDWPLATASVAVKLEGSRVSEARVVLGHVAPVPWRSQPAEEKLAGKALNERTAAEAAEAAVREAKPLSQNAYKVQLARVCLQRALRAVSA